MNRDPSPEAGSGVSGTSGRNRTRALVAVAGVVVLLAGIWLIVGRPVSSGPSEPPVARGPTHSGDATTSAGNGGPGASAVPTPSGPAPGAGGSPTVPDDGTEATGNAPRGDRSPDTSAPGGAPPGDGPTPANGALPRTGTLPGSNPAVGDPAVGNNPPAGNPPAGNPPAGGSPAPGNGDSAPGAMPGVNAPSTPPDGAQPPAPLATPSLEQGGGPPLAEGRQPLISVPLSPAPSADPVVFVAGPVPRRFYLLPSTENPVGGLPGTLLIRCRAFANEPPSAGGDTDIELRGVKILPAQAPVDPEVTPFEVDPRIDECAEIPGVAPDTRPCTARTALAVAGPTAKCVLGVRTSTLDRTDRTASLVADFRAVCTSTTGPPCDTAEVARTSPGVDRPVEVTWQQVVPLLACFERAPNAPVVDPDDPSGLRKICPKR